MQPPTLAALRRRAEVLAEFRTCSTPSGCVAMTFATKSERKDAAERDDEGRERREGGTGSDGRPKD